MFYKLSSYILHYIYSISLHISSFSSSLRSKSTSASLSEKIICFHTSSATGLRKSTNMHNAFVSNQLSLALKLEEISRVI